MNGYTVKILLVLKYLVIAFSTTAQHTDSIKFQFPDFSIIQSYNSPAIGVELEQTTIRQIYMHQIDIGCDKGYINNNERFELIRLFKEFEHDTHSIYKDHVVTDKERLSLSLLLKQLSSKLMELLNN